MAARPETPSAELLRIREELRCERALVADCHEALTGLMPRNLGRLPETMPDSSTLPLDVTFGELRKAIAVLARLEVR
jgi:hypothetical protein